VSEKKNKKKVLHTSEADYIFSCYFLFWNGDFVCFIE